MMDVTVARLLARADALPHDVQRRLWDTGDLMTQERLSRHGDLALDVAHAIIDSGSTRVWAAWAGGPRRAAGDLLSVSRRTTDQLVWVALVGNPGAPPSLLRQAAMEMGASVAAKVLERSDLALETRCLAVDKYLAGCDDIVTGMPRVVADRLGNDPHVWAHALVASVPRHPSILSHMPSLDEPAWQDALLDALEEFTRHRIDDPRVQRDIDRAFTNLARSPHLAPARALRAVALAQVISPTVTERLTRRTDRDLPALLRRMVCTLDGDVDLSPAHVSDVRALLSVNDVAFDYPSLAAEALLHGEHLDPELVGRTLASLRGDAARTLLVNVERSMGSDHPMLVAAIRAVGVWPVSSLQDPQPAMRALASQSYEQLLTGGHLPAGTAGTVAHHYVPVRSALSRGELAAVIAQAISEQDPQTAGAMWSLIGEWEGSLDELLCTVRLLDDHV